MREVFQGSRRIYELFGSNAGRSEQDDPDHEPRFSIQSAISLLVLAALIVFMVALSVPLLTGSSPSAVAEWISALSTLAAFCAAIIAGSYAGTAARYAAETVALERRRDELRDRQMILSQAVLISVWPESRVRHDFYRDGDNPSTDHMPIVPTQLTVALRNASKALITDVTIDLYVPPNPARRPTEVPYERIGIVRVGFVEPESVKKVEVFDGVHGRAIQQVIAGRDRSAEGPTDIELGFTFRDSGGTFWRHEPRRGIRPDPTALPRPQSVPSKEFPPRGNSQPDNPQH